MARSSHAACYLLLVGSVLSLISIVVYVWACPLTFGPSSLAFVPPSGPLLWILEFYILGVFVSASAAFPATISVFVGSAMWTDIINKTKDANPWKVQTAQLGIKVTVGDGLICAWVASGFMLASVIPLMIESASFFPLVPTTLEP